MISIVPTSSEFPFYEQRTVLSGVEYVLRFRWNGRAEKWTMDILDQEGTEIAGGLWVVADYPLNRLVVAQEAPPGVLLAVDTTGQGLDPGLRDLGSRVKLLYLEADDA